MSNQAVLPVPGQEQRVCCAQLTRAPIGEGEAAEVAHAWIYYRLVPAALASLAGLFTPELATIGPRRLEPHPPDRR